MEKKFDVGVDFSPLKGTGYREKIFVVKKEPYQFLLPSEIIGSEKANYSAFKECQKRPDSEKQIAALGKFFDWPEQAVVVALGEAVKEDDRLRLNMGDTIYLRPEAGMAMLIEDRLVWAISSNDIFYVKNVSKK